MKCGRWKRVIGALLAVVLICASFSGCAKSGAGANGDAGDAAGSSTQASGQQALGCFQEEELDTGVVFSNIYDMKKLEDGSLRIVGTDGGNGISGVWESKDGGKTWGSVYELPDQVQNSKKGWMEYAAISPGGQVVCAFNENTSDGARPVFWLVDKEGKANKMSFELPPKRGGQEEEGQGRLASMNLVMDLLFPSDEWVVLQDVADVVYQINVSDSSVKYTYELGQDTGVCQIHAVGNTLIVSWEAQVICYDLQAGERKGSEEALSKGSSGNGVFSAVDTLDGGKSAYFLSRGGLYHYKFGGSVMEQLMDGNKNSLGSPSFYPIALAMVDEQNLLVAANDTNSSSETEVCVLKYTYSEDAPAKPDKELKIYSFYDNKELRQSISHFQKEHSDVYVNYQVALADESAMKVSDALKMLTTEIMAGNGPDVLLLDGMPVEGYIEKGVLKDLSSLLKENGGSYFENIRGVYQDAQGRVCAAPARFMVPMIQAGGAYYMPGEDFDAFMERKGTMANMQPKMVVEKFWYTCGASWVKEDKTLDESKITEFLTKLKNAYGEYDSSLEGETEGGGVEEIEDIDFSRGNFKLAYGRINTNFGLCRELEYGLQKAVGQRLENGNMGLMPGQADHVFVPTMVMGISSKAAQPEMAEEFVKYLFSQEAQKVSQLGGFPVEKEAFHSVIDGHEYEGQEACMSIDDGDIDERLECPLEPTPEKEITKLTELVESLKTPSLQDGVIKEAVVEQGEKVLKGEQSPEAGAAAIMQKVNIYLAE